MKIKQSVKSLANGFKSIAEKQTPPVKEDARARQAPKQNQDNFSQGGSEQSQSAAKVTLAETKKPKMAIKQQSALISSMLSAAKKESREIINKKKGIVVWPSGQIFESKSLTGMSLSKSGTMTLADGTVLTRATLMSNLVRGHDGRQITARECDMLSREVLLELETKK